MSASKKNQKCFLFSAAACFLFFFLQHQIPLWSSDEGRFGEIAREMWASKNFIIPHFNYVAFLDKPVLAPVLTCLGFGFFGVSSVTARLVPILSALLGLFLVHRFAKRAFDEKTADYSALLLLTTIGYVLVGRFAVIDMLMTFFLSASLFSMFLAFWEKKPALYLLAYLCMGLGFLTKGLIGIVLPSGIFFVFLLWSRNLKELLRMKIFWGILIIAAVVLPWFLLAMKQKQDFFDVFIIQQHVHRFASGTFGRKRPFWFFVPILLGLGAPWTFFIPAAVLQGMKEKERELQKVKFLLCWILGILVFFSIPKSKLPYYILPATVPTALLIGNFFSRFTKETGARIPRALTSGVWKLFALAICAGAIGLNVYLSFFAHKPEILALKNFALAVTLILSAGFVTAYLQQRSRGFEKGILWLAATVYTGLILTFFGMKIITPLQSSFEEAALIQQFEKPGDVVAVVSSPDRFSDLPFHLKRRVTVAGSDWGTLKEQSELLPKDEQAEYFYDMSRFVTFFNTQSRRVLCLMEAEIFTEIQNLGLKNFRVLSNTHGKVLITNA